MKLNLFLSIIFLLLSLDRVQAKSVYDEVKAINMDQLGVYSKNSEEIDFANF